MGKQYKKETLEIITFKENGKAKQISFGTKDATGTKIVDLISNGIFTIEKSTGNFALVFDIDENEKRKRIGFITPFNTMISDLLTDFSPKSELAVMLINSLKGCKGETISQIKLKQLCAIYNGFEKKRFNEESKSSKKIEKYMA